MMSVIIPGESHSLFVGIWLAGYSLGVVERSGAYFACFGRSSAGELTDSYDTYHLVLLLLVSTLFVEGYALLLGSTGK
jgi:hypothetical protein